MVIQNKNEGNFFSFVPVASIVTGFIKLNKTYKSYLHAKKAQNIEEMGLLVNSVAAPILSKKIEFSTKKQLILGSLMQEMMFNGLETIPIAGNIIALVRYVKGLFSQKAPDRADIKANPALSAQKESHGKNPNSRPKIADVIELNPAATNQNLVNHPYNLSENKIKSVCCTS